MLSARLTVQQLLMVEFLMMLLEKIVISPSNFRHGIVQKEHFSRNLHTRKQMELQQEWFQVFALYQVRQYQL